MRRLGIVIVTLFTGTLVLVSGLSLIAGLPQLVGYAVEGVSWSNRELSPSLLTLFGGLLLGGSLAFFGVQMSGADRPKAPLAALAMWGVVVGVTLIFSSSQRQVLSRAGNFTQSVQRDGGRKEGAPRHDAKPDGAKNAAREEPKADAGVVPVNYAEPEPAAFEEPAAASAPEVPPPRASAPPATTGEPVRVRPTPVQTQVTTTTTSESSSSSESVASGDGAATATAEGSAKSESSVEVVSK
jgi:hypothetical protein